MNEDDLLAKKIFLERLGIIEGIKVVDPEKLMEQVKFPVSINAMPNMIDRDFSHTIDNMGLVGARPEKININSVERKEDGAIQYKSSLSQTHLRVIPHANN